MRTKAFLWTIVGCLVAPSIATAQTVYFSIGSDIRKLTLGSSGTSLVYSGVLQVGDLALCAGDPDVTPISPGRQYLYFVERDAAGDRISRLDVNASSFPTTGQLVYTQPGTIKEIRLDKNCSVFLARPGGVFLVTGESTATEKVVTSAGSGLAMALNGNLKYSTGSQIKSLPSGPIGSTTTAIVGVGVANGGDGSVNQSFFDAGDVCASTSNTLKCGLKAGGSLTRTLATFSGGSKPQYFEFLTNDVAIVATSENPTTAINGNGNGFLWRVNSPTSKTELFKAPKNSNNQYPPIVGVAVGPSSSNVVQTASGTTHRVNFGPVGVDVVTRLACSLKIQLHQLSWSQVQAKLNPILLSSGNTYQKDPGDGGESWIDLINVSKLSPGDCGLPSDNAAAVGLSQFNDPTNSKAVVRCHQGDPTCTVITEGNFPYSTPEDPRDSGREDDFSDFFTAQVVSEGNSGNRDIVFNAPLHNEAAFKGAVIPQTAIDAASEHNWTSGLSIRFTICSTATNCTKFAEAELPNTPESGAGLSVSALDDDGVPITDCDVDDSGGANPDRPVFRTSEKTHNFNLHSPLLDLPGSSNVCSMGDLPAGGSRLFVATVFSYSGKFNKTAIVFRLVK